MALVYVSLGSNMGNRDAYVKNGIEAIRELGDVLEVSSVLETDPVDFLDQPKFLNAVVALETNLEPLDLLHELQRIETENGRVRTIDKGPRTLDLDILTYGNQNINTPELTIPHPEMQNREFIQQLLSEF